MAELCSARGPRGVVAAAAPAAARIGAAALDDGGNAYDAVVAAALAETVLLPPKCGLAGDLVALTWTREAAAPMALLAIGGAARGLEAAARRGELTETGPMSVGVPGAPDGYRALAERGRLGLARLARPAIDVALGGFCWSLICTVLADESAALVHTHNPVGTNYFPEGMPIEPGAIVRLPGLARCLEEFAGAPDEFLGGVVGRAIVDRVQEAGGVLDLEDMEFAGAEWTSTSKIRIHDSDLHVTPAPTHGPSLLDALADLTTPAPTPGDVYTNVMAAIAQRRRSLSDPSGTSMVSAVDADGTLVTIVHSNSFPRFGSGLVVSEFDLILSNRAGRGFDDTPDHPNSPVAGRRPATTLHAWGLDTGSGTQMLGATPGGANQMPWNAQTLARLATGSDVARAVVGPRWEWQPADDGILVEDGFTPEEIATLEIAAPRVDRIGRWGVRSAMQVITGPDEQGVATAVVDPRTGGAVVAL